MHDRDVVHLLHCIHVVSGSNTPRNYERPDGQLASAPAFGTQASGSNPGGGMGVLCILKEKRFDDDVDERCGFQAIVAIFSIFNRVRTEDTSFPSPFRSAAKTPHGGCVRPPLCEAIDVNYECYYDTLLTSPPGRQRSTKTRLRIPPSLANRVCARASE
ncbi:hypothetical protein CEXT_320411 [Caerostris extrusa]|uniref:Uncharacterized protein n=1 Tax=Caerostris extrusa TaxID=172846 RepID=A0AAV4QV21_CAEEX|nr:hypothetical protein CEXT_320411 [Caerostris extrusa]